MSEPKDVRGKAAATRKVSAFASAIRSSSIGVEITADDVCGMRPDWSRAQAESFLDDHAETIACEMLVAGIRFVNNLIGDNGRGN